MPSPHPTHNLLLRRLSEETEICDNMGSGVVVETRGDVTLNKNAIHSNQLAGVILHKGATARLTGNTITSNDIAGVCICNSTAALEDNIILHNGETKAFHSEEAFAWSTVAAVQYRTGHGFPGLWVENEAMVEHWAGGNVIEDNNARVAQILCL